jgi:hypothetical protein
MKPMNGDGMEPVPTPIRARPRNPRLAVDGSWKVAMFREHAVGPGTVHWEGSLTRPPGTLSQRARAA